MPKPSTLPTLFDNSLQLDINTLRRDGFIIPGRMRSGTLSWKNRYGERTASIGFTVNMSSAAPYVELYYKYGDEPRKYQVRLVSIPSNLEAGEVWYFLCPDTGKRCRILYFVNGWFLHREAFRGAYYDSQVQSKGMRSYLRVVSPLFKVDKLREELRKPYFKRYHAGLPTKRYTRIKKKLERAERVSIEDYERVAAGIF